MAEFLRIPRRRRFDEDDYDDIIIRSDRPRPPRRRRRQKETPDLEEALHWMKKQVDVVEKHVNEQKEKYKSQPPKHKVPYATGLALTFFFAPLVWIIASALFYSLAKNALLGVN